MVNVDSYGLPISTNSDVAAAAFRDGIDRILSGWPGAGRAFDGAVAADEGFALAHSARARVLALGGQGAAANVSLGLARKHAANWGTEREKSHIDVFAHAIEGRPHKTLESAIVHIGTWPRDAFVMSLFLGALGLFAFSGKKNHDQARVDLCELNRSHYGDDWWFLSHLGWSHTENGNVGIGRAVSERALGIRKSNANAVHGLAHAMFEDGSSSEANELIDSWLPCYDRSAPLYSHISSHQAWAALDRGDVKQALEIYTEQIQPSATSALPINVVSDSASFLWRMKTYGHAVPKRLWDDAEKFSAGAFPNAGVPFIDVHMALIEAATGKHTALNSRIKALEKLVSAGDLVAGAVVPAICQAAQAFANNDFTRCATILEPFTDDVVRVGGSHAQREVIEDTLIVAYMASNQSAKALLLLDQRLHRRPSARDQAWSSSLSS